MANKKRINPIKHKVTVNIYLIIGLIVTTAILSVYVSMYIFTPTTVQSYAGSPGAPDKPPKNIYNTVTGKVYNSSGSVIQRAQILTWQKTVKRTFYTDKNGVYLIQFPYCENCKSVITYSATGYITQNIDTYQIAGGTLVQDVVLQKQ